MAVSYNKLWKLLVDKKMSKSDLRKKAEIAPNATTDEVAQVAWMNREQIKELFENNMFVETLEYFFTEVDK